MKYYSQSEEVKDFGLMIEKVEKTFEFINKIECSQVFYKACDFSESEPLLIKEATSKGYVSHSRNGVYYMFIDYMFCRLQGKERCAFLSVMYKHDQF
jgi:hypothetical protein